MLTLIARAIAIARAGLAGAGVACASLGFGFVLFSVCLHIVILSTGLTWLGLNSYRTEWNFRCIGGGWWEF
jgi:hypothetical protein